MKNILLTAVLFFFALFQVSVKAAEPRTKNVKVSLYPERTAVKAGDSLYVAIVLKISKDWHIYWQNPGNSGMETKATAVLPDGFTMKGVIYPVPVRFVEEEIISLGYKNEAVLLAVIETPANAKNGTYSLKFNINWLECKEVCIPGKAEADVIIKISDKQTRQNKKWLSYYERYIQSFPGMAPDISVSAYRKGDAVLFDLNCNASAKESVDFDVFPIEQGIYEYTKPKVIFSNNKMTAELKLDSFREQEPVRLKALLFSPMGWNCGSSAKAFYIDEEIK